MAYVQYIFVFFMLLPGACFSMMRQGPFTEEPMISSSRARKYLKTPEEIRQMPKSEVEVLRKKLQAKGLWEDYVKVGGKLSESTDPLVRQCIRLILLPYQRGEIWMVF